LPSPTTPVPGLIGLKPLVPGSTTGGVGITGIGGGVSGIGGGVGGIGGGGKATIGGGVIRPGGVGKAGLPDLERQIAQAARTMGTSLSAAGQAPTLPSSAADAAGAAPTTRAGGTPMAPMAGGMAGGMGGPGAGAGGGASRGGGAGAGGNEGPRSRHRIPSGTIRAPQVDERPVGEAPGVPSGLKGRSSKPDRDDGFPVVMPLPTATRRPTKQRDQAKSLELLDEDLWNVDDDKPNPLH
jgi:hypothetical protein